MKDELRHGILWTVALSLLFFWFFSFTVRGLIDAEHQPTVYHYKYKTCPIPTGR